MLMPPFPLILDTLLKVLLPAAGVAGVVLAVCKAVGGKNASGAGAAVGLAFGYGLANYLCGAMPWLPDGYDWHWLPWLGLAALLAGTVCNLPGRPRAGLWLTALVGSGLWVLMPAELRLSPWWSVPAFEVIVVAGWAAADEQANRLPGAVVPCWLALAMLAGAVVLIHAGIARFMDVALTMAAGLGGIALASLWRPGKTGSVMGAACVVLAGLMLVGWTNGVSEVPLTCFALVGLAPATLGLTLFGPPSGLATWRRILVQTVVLLAPLVAAVILAMRAESIEF